MAQDGNNGVNLVNEARTLWEIPTLLGNLVSISVGAVGNLVSEPLQAYWTHWSHGTQPGEEEIEDPETQRMQGEVSQRSVTTVGKEDTLPETVTNPGEEKLPPGRST